MAQAVTQTIIEEMAQAASRTGMLIIDGDVRAAMEKAAAMAGKLPRPARKVNKEARRHISFLLRQWGIEQTYKEVGR